MSKHIAHVVFKYPLSGLDECLIPAGAIVHVGIQHASDPLPTLWVQHVAEWDDDGGEPPQVTTTRQLRINIVATGQPFTPDPSGSATDNHVGSAVCANGNLVWHIYASETGAS